MAGDKSLEQKVLALTQHNGRLSVLLEEKRRESKVLEERVVKSEHRENEYVETLLTVDRIWDQLSQDIVTACSASNNGVAEDDGKSAGATTTASSTSITDPFLRRLLRAADPAALKPVQDACKKLDAGRGDVETALQDRAQGTKSALSKLLARVQEITDKQDATTAQLLAMAPDAALRAECKRLTSESGALRRQLDAGRALQRCMNEQMHSLESRHVQLEETLRKTQNELGDTEQELSNSQRKYHALKTDAGANAHANCKQEAVAVKTENDSTKQDELRDLRDVLAKRSSELDSMREQNLRSQRDLQAALARCTDESWVSQTKTHKQLMQEIQRLNEMLGSKTKELDNIARERDEAVRDAMVKMQYYHAERLSRQKLAAADQMYRSLQADKAEGDRSRLELELALQREREKYGNTKTVEELHTLVGTLQTQLAQQQQHDRLNKVTVERLEASAAQVATCQGKLEAKALEIQRLYDKLRQKDTDKEEQKRQEQALKDRISDLKAFVDVLTVYCNDVRDISEVRASEAVLKDQVASLKAQLERIRELEVAERAAKDATEFATVDADSLRMEITGSKHIITELAEQLKESRAECELYISEIEESNRRTGITGYKHIITELAEQLKESRAECELYISGIETTGAAYEDMQSQNARLLQQLLEKDEVTNQYMADRIKEVTNQYVADRIKMTKAQQQLSEQLEAARSDAERLVKDHTDLASMKQASDNEIAKLAQEITVAKEQIRVLSLRAESQGQEILQRDDAVAKLQYQLDSLTKQVAETKGRLEEADEKTLKDASKRQRLEDDGKMLTAKVDRLRKSSTVGGATKELQEEIDAMRSLLNCNVCHERQKNVIITKCCHVFCDKCIKRNVEARNRKCPGCAQPFGLADVKSFFFT
eukprot:gene3932-14009_t